MTDAPHLADLAARLDAGVDLGPAERRMLACVLRAVADGRPAAAVAAGQARRRRDDLLREVRARYFADATESGAAKAIADRLKRYEAGAWRIDRHGNRLAGKPGSLARALFDVLTTGAAPGWRTIARCLSSKP